MKRMWLIPVFCITALCCVLFAPQMSQADDFGFSFDKVPSSVTHGKLFVMILHITVPDDHGEGLLRIDDMSDGMVFQRASVAGSGSWFIKPVYMSPYTFSALYRVSDTVTDHVTASFSVLYVPPEGHPESLLKTVEIPVVHEPGPWTIITEATCLTPGMKTANCTYCMVEMKEEIPVLSGGLSQSGHVAGEWVVTQAATNKTTGIQEKTCTLCGTILETKTIPILSETWPDNTACSLGLRFRDEAPDLTDKWYMYTPVDLTQDGVQTFPLIASNVHIIGTVSVTVDDGKATVAYKLDTKKIKVKDEFLTFFPDLESVKAVEPEELKEQGFLFGELIQVAEQLHGADSVLLFLRLVIDYDIYADGVKRYYESVYHR
jgi:hypothetical protein